MNLLPDTIEMGRVALTVADLPRSLNYYQERIGLRLLQREGPTAVLGTTERPLLILREQPGARPARGMTGLYHFALLLPSRLALAQTLRHLVQSETPISGAADHHVSEAIYLTDPDGHGIEIYRDRPRVDWVDENGRFHLTTEPFDADGVLSELTSDAPGWTGLPAQTVMGHVHLHVSQMTPTLDFYLNTLGFSLMARYGPSASFVAAGGYHHHLGLNTWAGIGASPPGADRARLLWYEILLPDEAALGLLAARLGDAGVAYEEGENGRSLHFQDPSANHLIIRSSES